jgi:hypothetical protein
MDTQSVRLSGKFNIPEPIEIDNSYTLTLEGSVVSISKFSQENGEYEICYHIKPSHGEITGKGGKTAKLTQKTRHSLILRRLLAQIAQDRGIDADLFYGQVMASLEYNIMFVLDQLEGLKGV